MYAKGESARFHDVIILSLSNKMIPVWNRLLRIKTELALKYASLTFIWWIDVAKFFPRMRDRRIILPSMREISYHSFFDMNKMDPNHNSRILPITTSFPTTQFQWYTVGLDFYPYFFDLFKFLNCLYFPDIVGRRETRHDRDQSEFRLRLWACLRIRWYLQKTNIVLDF